MPPCGYIQSVSYPVNMQLHGWGSVYVTPHSYHFYIMHFDIVKYIMYVLPHQHAASSMNRCGNGTRCAAGSRSIICIYLYILQKYYTLCKSSIHINTNCCTESLFLHVVCDMQPRGSSGVGGERDVQLVCLLSYALYNILIDSIEV